MTTVRKWSCEESHYVAGNSHVFIHTLVDVHTHTRTRPNVCTKHTFMHGEREEWSYGQRENNDKMKGKTDIEAEWIEMKRRTGMEEEKDSYRTCMNEFVCAREWEGTPPYLTLTRDLGAWHHVYSRVQTALLLLTDSNPPPLPLFLALELFLFCFHKQQKGRQGFIKAGDILPPPFPLLHHLNGQITQMGRLPQDNFT